MKKITLLFLLMWTMLGQAQLKDYVFTSVAGTYSEITAQMGATTLGDATANTQIYIDPNVTLGGTSTVGPGFDMFNFVFDGRTYNKFAVSNDGWISLGSSSINPNHVDMTVANTLLPLTSAGTSLQPDQLCASIAPLANDLAAQSNSTLSYLISGSSPNRTLTIQWKNYRRSSVASGDSFNFQIILKETANTVQFVYGPFQATSTTLNFQVGLRSYPAGTATNYAMRKFSTAWDNSVTATATSDRMRINDTAFPQSGLTYTWIPPTCGSVKNLVASNITDSSATLTWGANTPTPISFEYVVTPSSVAPASGTVTTATTANLTNLNPNTVYNVFTRTQCTSTSSEFTLTGTFKTKCTEAATLAEDFDSYSSGLPDCWSWARASVSTEAAAYITNGSGISGSAPSRLYMFANGAASAVSYTILPVMSNISADTNRLRFKAYAEMGQMGRTLEVGYFLDMNDLNSFQVLQQKDLPSGASNAIEFTVIPTGVPSTVKNLVFRNAGISTSATIAYVDDVTWEPNPTCVDVSGVTAKAVTNNSVTAVWTAGTTTAWQYVYAPASVKNPYTLTGTDVPGSNPTVQIAGLAPSTIYKVWIRSACSGSYGVWIGPVIFETACPPVSELSESFDVAPPSCWRKVGKSGVVAVVSQSASPFAPSSPNVLSLVGSDLNGTIVALPALSNAQAGTHELRLKIRGSVEGLKLDIGYLTDLTDPDTFVILQTKGVGTSYSSELVKLGSAPQSQYLALRNYGTTATLFIDDVIWEPIPTCSDVLDITSTVNSNSVKLHWKTEGTESQWQYVMGSALDANPFALEIKDLPSTQDLTGYKATISSLTPNTSYRLWVRSKCSGTSFGAWSEPINLLTSCVPGTEFNEKFDSSTSLPSCWKRSGVTGFISVGSVSAGTNAPSVPNALKLEANAASGAAVVAMPAMSNTAAGTHRLDFKYRSEIGVGNLEVGYLLNLADPNSFVPLVAPLACSNTFQDASLDLKTDPGSQILAFRNSGNPYCIISIDNVSWALTPVCEKISNLTVTSVSHSAIKFKWTKGASETVWQYAIGTASTPNPDGLVYYEVEEDPQAIATKLSSTVSVAPSTSYRIWVRSKCGDNLFSTWEGPITATTTCAPIDSFIENFSGSSKIPDCWMRIGTQGTSDDVKITTSASEPNDGNKLFMYSGSEATASIIAMPPLSNASTGDHILKFRFKGTSAAAKVQVGYITNVLDPNSFSPIHTYEASSTETSDVITLKLSTSPVSDIIAFRNPGLNSSTVLIDDVSWTLIPTQVPACITSATATTNPNCGNYATVITWNAVDLADGYLIDISTAAGSDYIVKDQKVGTELSYSFTGDYKTTYYYSIRPYNSVGSNHECPTLSFTTVANGCYCISAPAAIDNHGIPTIQIADKEFENPEVSYTDFTSQPVDVAKGDVDLKITFNTFWPYNAKAWIDFNDDFTFSSNEEVFFGGSTAGWLSVVEDKFNIPSDAALGLHRMRIVTSKSGVDSPCFNGAYGVTLDFNVNIIEGTVLATDKFNDTNFSYYPNPVKDMLNISLDEEISDVVVMNILGQQLITKTVNGKQAQIDMSGLSRGTYLVKVNAGNQSKTVKAIKE